ncbi:MAG TPA: TonB-dependent receptor [Steroidobacteraceae bacterium]|nr:TonB-dependent receptor [Steroidobacteraceae bacterium]
MRIPLRRSALGVLFCVCSMPVLAAEKDAADVIVTATRTEQNVDNVIASVTVITREDIERRQLQSLQDVLRGEVGVDITNQGGLGKFTSLFMRGAGSGHILVLVDGVRVGNATSGTTSFEYIPVDQIERIEIVRGPRSSIYGSDAISGVIQIFTRRAAPGISTSVGVAPDETYRGTASVGLVEDNYWLNLTADRLQTDGFNSCRGSFDDACFTFEPDRDGYRNTSATARAGYRWGEAADVEFSTLYAKGKSEFDGSFQNEAEFRQIIPTLHGRVRVADALTLKLTLGDSHDDVDSLYNGEFRSEFNTEKRTGTLQADWQIAPAQLLTLGGDYIDDRIESSTEFDRTHRDNTGLFGVYQARFGQHEAELSGRYDDNEQFGSHGSGNIGWKWHVSPTLALTATYGSAFRAPTFNDLYYPGFSNPDLDPEKAHSYEVGVSGRVPLGRWSINGFVTQIDDMIDLNSSFVPENIAEARIRGIETFAELAFDRWLIDFNYSWLDPRNRGDGPNFDNLLQRRARHSARTQVMRSFGTFSLGTEVRGQGKRYNDAANTVRLGSYVVADVLGEVKLGTDWVIQAKVANVFDRDYETVYLFNEPNRTYSLTVRYSPTALK